MTINTWVERHQGAHARLRGPWTRVSALMRSDAKQKERTVAFTNEQHRQLREAADRSNITQYLLES
jgi:hypothetical protein